MFWQFSCPGPSEGISYFPKQNLVTTFAYLQRVIEKKSFLSWMIDLPIQSASASTKENFEANVFFLTQKFPRAEVFAL